MIGVFRSYLQLVVRFLTLQPREIHLEVRSAWFNITTYMAVLGPFYSAYTDRFNYREVYRQWLYKSHPLKRSMDLPYQVFRYSCSGVGGYWNYVNADIIHSWGANNASSMYTRCYDKFYSKAFDTANVGLTAIDYRSSLTMITVRAGQLARALRHLKNARFRTLAAELGLDAGDARTSRAISRARRLVGQPSRQWLEFTFGWSPLVSDIRDAVKVLKQDFPSSRCKASVSDNRYYITQWDGSSSFNVRNNDKYTIRATVVITNSNALLARQLGLANPAYVAWDAVPFSFVVDWFIPVGKFLNSFSNDVGIELQNVSRGWSSMSTGYSRHIDHGGGSQSRFRAWGGERAIGSLPRPGIFDRLRLPPVTPWLAATSVALVVTNWRKALMVRQ